MIQREKWSMRDTRTTLTTYGTHAGKPAPSLTSGLSLQITPVTLLFNVPQRAVYAVTLY